MTNYRVILCKPKNNEVLAKLSLPADDADFFADLERLNTSLEPLPNDDLIAEYKKLDPDAVVALDMMTVKRNDVHVKLQFAPRYVTFEHVGIQFCNQPYWNLETVAGKFNCMIYDPQTQFLIERPPGSVVKARRKTLLNDVPQIPLTSDLIMRLYIGYSEEDVEQIEQRTGIQFEQRLDNLDYAEIACIEVLSVPIFIRRYLRAPQIAVEFWSTLDPIPHDLTQLLSEKFSLIN